MTVKLFAVVLLALAIAACEPSSTDNNANNPKPAASPQVAATPAPISSPEASPAAVQLKAGDKVKVTIKGSTADATVVSVDDKANNVRVRINGQKDDKTVPMADVTRQ